MTAQEAAAATAKRLAALCCQSKSRNFQETALAGASPELRTLVLEDYRLMLKQPTALLGHEGRPYSTEIVVDKGSQ